MHKERLTLGLVLGLLAVILFGGSPPATRVAVLGLDPFFMTAARGAIAGLLAGAVLIALRRPVPWRDMRMLVPISLCLVILFPTTLALGMTALSSAHGGVVLGLLPIATAVAAVFFAHERPSAFFWAMSLLGAVLVVVFSLRDGGIMPTPADFILFVGVAICGTGYAFAGTLSRRMPGWEVISWGVVIALPVTVPLSFLLWPKDVADVGWPSWAGLAYAAAISQYFGFWLWNSALAAGGVARIAQLQLLQPFSTLAIAAFVLGERVDLRTILFAIAVVVVVTVGVRARVASRQKPVTLVGATGRG